MKTKPDQSGCVFVVSGKFNFCDKSLENELKKVNTHSASTVCVRYVPFCNPKVLWDERTVNGKK